MANSLHIDEPSSQRRIYLDHAATTPVRREVADVIYETMTNLYGNASSFYREAVAASHELEKSRRTIADCLGVRSEEIFFTSCGTEADNWAIKGAYWAQANNNKKHLIISPIEHHAVLHTANFLKKMGADISILPVNSKGLVDPDELDKMLTERPDTFMVSVMLANNEIGTIEPIAELGAICKKHGVLFHSDGVQALGAIPVKPHELNTDLMAFSGHKLYAPKGVGFLYKRMGTRVLPFIDGGAQERKQRAGTENLPYIAGLAKAVALAHADMKDEAMRQTKLRDAIIEGIFAQIPHVKLNGDLEHRLPNNVNFSFEFIEGESMLLLLDEAGYCCSSGSACTSASLDPSHVLLAIGNPAEVAHGSLRITVGRENTMADIKSFLQDLPPIVQRLRNMSPLYDDFKNGKIKPLTPEYRGTELVRSGGYGI